MVTIEGQKQFNISRKAASELLKISIRTVDRYVKLKRVSSRVVNGRIWLDRDEIDLLKSGQESQVRVVNRDVSTLKTSIDNVDNIEIVDHDFVDNLSTMSNKTRPREENTYKKLYEELKEELNEKQERLEIANYRVGQLESQVKNSIPMLEYHHERFMLKRSEEDLQEKLTESTGIIKRLATNLKQAKLSKRIFLIILLIILALQPLWLLPHLNNLF